MSANDPSTGPGDSPRGIPARFRAAGLLVLAAGLLVAAWVWWRGGPGETVTSGDFKAETRASQIYFGSSGQLMEELGAALSRPATQAILILLFAGILAVACFGFARWLESGPEAE